MMSNMKIQTGKIKWLSKLRSKSTALHQLSFMFWLAYYDRITSPADNPADFCEKLDCSVAL